MGMQRALDVATLLVMAVIAVTTLALHVSGPARPALLQQTAHWPPGHTLQRPSPSTVLGQQAKILEASAHTLSQKAQQMEAAGRKTQQAAARSASQAEEAVAVEKYLQESKTELNAYTKNIEGLVSAAARSQSGLANFPQQAAELHALLDHSLSEADSTAVKIVRTRGGAGGAGGASRDRRAHALHINAAASGINVAALPLLKGVDMGIAPANPAVASVMKKLRAVKAYAQGFHKGELEAEASASLKSGRTHQLVQNSPLIGAVYAHHGELVNDEMRYGAKDMGLEKEERGADAKRAPCNSTCQETILESTVGLTFKVATKCIEDCSTGVYAHKMTGGPLPQWTTVDELKEQDTFCRGSTAYKQCKHDELDPVCDKLTEYMPGHCLVKQADAICKSCREVQGYECELGISSCEEEEPDMF